MKIKYVITKAVKIELKTVFDFVLAAAVDAHNKAGRSVCKHI